MADRVFPNSVQNMGSKIEFSGIDWEGVQKDIKNGRFAEDLNKNEQIIDLITKLRDVDPTQIEEISDMIDEKFVNDLDVDNSDTESDLDMEDDSNLEGDVDVEEDSMDDQMDPVTHFKMDEEFDDSEFESDADNDESMCDDEDEDGDIKEFMSISANNNSGRKITFNHPNQISAEAIEAAKRAGDTKLVNTILAARKENRKKIANALVSRVKSAQIENKPVVAQSKNVELEFTSPKDFTAAQRLAFNAAAVKNGLPSKYVESMAPFKMSESVEALNGSIKEVYSSNMSSDMKDTVISNLVKEAKLSPESKSEFVDYWNNVLGYQDKDFWPDVAKNYTAEGEEKVD